MKFRFRAGDGGPRRRPSRFSRPRGRRFTPRAGLGPLHGVPPPPPQMEWEAAAAARRELIIREEVERRLIEEEVRRELARRLHGGFGPEPFFRSDGPFVPPPPPGPLLGVDVPFMPPTRPPPIPAGMHQNGPRPASFRPRQVKELTTPSSEATISGGKRKADVIAAPTEPIKAQKAAQLDWSCALCQVRTSSEVDLNTHLEGKKHKAKLAQCGPIEVVGDYGNRCQATTGNSGCTTDVPTRKISILVDGVVHEVVQKNNYLWCERCKVRCENNMAMADHLRGKKHSELNKVWKSINAARLNKSKQGSASASTCKRKVNEIIPIAVAEKKEEAQDEGWYCRSSRSPRKAPN